MSAKQRSIGILLLTHSTLGKHLCSTAAQIIPEPVDGIECLGIGKSHDLARVRRALDVCMAKLSRSFSDVVVMCDAFGATASRLLRERPPAQLRIRFVFGVNLPMLLEAIGQRNTLDLDALAKKICKIGRESIFVGEAAATGRIPRQRI